MSTLIILLAAQPRLAVHSSVAPAAPAEFDYVLSADGQRASEHGRAAAAALPRAAQAVAVLRPGDVAFQHIEIPKAPPARMRAALSGSMEEALLEDESEVHLALEPGAKPGGLHWVAVVNRPWLRVQLEALDHANVPVDRAVPAWWPDEGVAGHVFRNGNADEAAHLAWRDHQGVLCVPLASEVARALVTALAPDTAVRWTATPETAAQASQFVGTAVPAVTDAEQALRAARSGWNLRQFDLAAQRRGVKQLRETAARFAFDPAWRMTRIGLGALIAIQLVGLNARAFQERRALTQKQAALTSAVTAAFPNIKSVYNAPAQAQKEMDALRAAAGRPGDGDIETLLHAAESAWPAGHPPVESVRYQPNRLTLAASGWTPQEIDLFVGQLRAAGVHVEPAAGKLELSPARPALPTQKGKS